MSLSTQVELGVASELAGVNQPCRLVFGVPFDAGGVPFAETFDPTSGVSSQTCDPKSLPFAAGSQPTFDRLTPSHCPIVIVPPWGVIWLWVPDAMTASVLASSCTQLSGLPPVA